MFKTAKRISKARPWMFESLLLAVACLVVGVIAGSTFHNSFGASTKESFQQLMDEAMTSMDRGMENAPMTGDPDHDFAAMMIPHHQGAVDMAKVELLYGKDPVLRRLAQEIIVTQEQEIEVMRMRLKQFKTQ
ncbi:MAG: DUF305 domain-containing protein [Thermodesulfovibrionales bacterium]